MNPRYNLKRQDGFTMIEIMVVVVIVAILAAIAVPIYTKYVESARASEAKSVIGSISNSMDMYFQTYGEFPGDVEELERYGLLELKLATKRMWIFEISDQEIRGTSTGDMPGGEGKEIIYDRESGRFSGYGSEDSNT